MNIVWNRVTWYSKLAALFFFIIILPAWTFYIGIQYQKTKNILEQSQPTTLQKIPTVISDTGSASNEALLVGDFEYWKARGLERENFVTFFKNIQLLVKNNDKQELSKLVHYPLNTDLSTLIYSPADFINHYDELFNSAFKKRILDADTNKLILESDIGVSNGALWLRDVYGPKDGDRGFFIVTVNNDLPIMNQQSTVPQGVTKYTIEKDRDNSIYALITDYSNKEVQYAVNNQLKQIRYDNSCTFNDGPSVDSLRSELLSRNEWSNTQYSQVQVDRMSEDQLLKALGWYSSILSIPTYTSNDIFSVHMTYDENCGGAHPSSGDSSMTFDMKTGQEIPFIALFNNFLQDKQKITDLVVTHYKASEKGEVSEDCLQAIDSESIEFGSYYIDKDGLKIIPSLPHVVNVCAGDIPMPIKEIAPYLRSTTILKRYTN